MGFSPLDCPRWRGRGGRRLKPDGGVFGDGNTTFWCLCPQRRRDPLRSPFLLLDKGRLFLVVCGVEVVVYDETSHFGCVSASEGVVLQVFPSPPSSFLFISSLFLSCSLLRGAIRRVERRTVIAETLCDPPSGRLAVLVVDPSDDASKRLAVFPESSDAILLFVPERADQHWEKEERRREEEKERRREEEKKRRREEEKKRRREGEGCSRALWST